VVVLLFLALGLATLHSGCAGVAGSSNTSGPTVSITSPTSGATVSSSTAVSANASANTVGVQFKLDGANLGSEITAAPFSISWDTTTTANGQHTLTAVARNGSGQTATSSPVTITVQNSPGGGPTVSITSPTSGATVSASITILANVSANVIGVQFKLDGTNLGAEKTSTPFSISWDTTTTANGQHTLTAVARNGSGQTATSSPVTITVQNSSGGNPPVISGISASPNSDSALILWVTDQPSDSQVDYGITAGYGQSSVLDSAPVISHSVSISGLASTTSYHFRVKSRGTSGLLATSGDNSFTTPSGSGGIPPGLGWFQIPNTTLQAVCDNSSTPWHAALGCAGITAAWNGGIADTVRNRLIVWGGGHNDYWGNEVYSLNLSNLSFTRLNSPANPTPLCSSAFADGTPSSRHTYAGLAYMGPTNDTMYVYGGAYSCPSGGSIADTWTLNLANVANPVTAWARKDPVTGPATSGLPCAVSDYDPNTNSVFLYDTANLFKYNLPNNTYTQLSFFAGSCSYNGAIDPGRKLMYMFGGGQVLKIDISGTDRNYTVQDISASVTTCDVMKSAGAPGIAYDSVQQRLVGWSGGSTVYVFNPDTNTCTPVSYPNGPGAAQSNGTYGRFRYFPNLRVFALVNDWQQNAYTLRLTPAP
jgi:Bacterial Ig domain